MFEQSFMYVATAIFAIVLLFVVRLAARDDARCLAYSLLGGHILFVGIAFSLFTIHAPLLAATLCWVMAVIFFLLALWQLMKCAHVPITRATNK